MFYLIFVEWLGEWLRERGWYGPLGIFDQVQFRALAAAGLSFLLVLLFGRRTIRWLVRMKIGDSGATDAEALREHNSSKANTPTMGGLLIVGAIAGSTFLLADLSHFYVYMGLVVLFWLAAVGGVDDYLKLTAKSRGGGSRQGLYAWEKLIFQLGIGLLVGWFVYARAEAGDDVRHVLNLPFQKTYMRAGQLNPSLIFLGPAAFVAIATLMIAGMSNAVNITDGMDGLAGGVSAIVGVGVFVLAMIAGDQGTAQMLLVPSIPGAGELGVLAGATVGACLGFLWWNCSPAQVFMGDTGALSLGGVIGYIAVVTRQEFLVLVMSGVFLLEIGSVALQVGYFKVSGGKRIFRVAPYHHHLHLGGWPEPQIVARLWIVSVLLVVLALALIKVR
ncbi:MAG: phospho-N-acetylmuramoyl-pentapeptide-transferase [Phycisphaerae bacterium]|nr:MAG: phospho-N-acetylmuramoyl-pentapeptide-transferase [Phycisphaerae bacterium]